MSPAPRVLIVEDEVRLLHHLSRILVEGGMSVFTCGSYQELEGMLNLSTTARFDLFILDRLLQNKDSAELLPRLKAHFPTAKTMILSAINSAAERALLLDMGADDYMGKPFDSAELVARTRALLRRGKTEIVFGNLILDSENRLLKVDGNEVSLTNKEFLLLRTLVQWPGKIFNKTYLYDQVWEIKADVESNVVEATMNKIRRRLKESGANVTIKNTRNIGYWIEK
ncbi:MAG: response regulator transcription factor [Bdellovibrionales bacterium]|nr:response regulator transcription factor [Bdellovibrionales bacterium]